MNISTILKAKGGTVTTALATSTLQSIAERLAAEKIGAIVICDDNGAVIGIMSERDLVRAIAEGGPSTLSKPASAVMTKTVTTCTLDHSIDELMALMTTGRFRHVPVMDNDRLVGIVSIGDVVKNHIAEVEMEVSAMRGYLATG
ncbi:MAG: CBS domain-containing protein [Pseudomonadota bacterium]